MNIISLHIAEGPGGFIEATRYIRSKSKCKDIAFGITLIDEYIKNVPGWKQTNTFLRNHPEVIISYGADGTGNIYNVRNIVKLEEEIKSKYNITYNPDIYHCAKLSKKKSNNENNFIKESNNDGIVTGLVYLITADGGFDYSIDYNYQEQTSCKLIFSEVIIALRNQTKGGIFICKFFDIITYFNCQILYLLYLVYDEVIIYKPATSRIANSEKYIICKGFNGIDNKLVDRLTNILQYWNELQTTTINYIFNEIPSEFINYIKHINGLIIGKQICSINNALNILKTNKILHDKQWKISNLEKQKQNAREWCKKYNIPYKQNK
jgi:23S rRNA U2552 (ribose-2'-O)-methylase RlmE/FtsJ